MSRRKIITSYLDLWKKQSKMYIENRESFIKLEIESKKGAKPATDTIEREERDKVNESLSEERSRSRNRKWF